jgi:hypothetical protein
MIWEAFINWVDRCLKGWRRLPVITLLILASGLLILFDFALVVVLAEYVLERSGR